MRKLPLFVAAALSGCVILVACGIVAYREHARKAAITEITRQLQKDVDEIESGAGPDAAQRACTLYRDMAMCYRRIGKLYSYPYSVDQSVTAQIYNDYADVKEPALLAALQFSKSEATTHSAEEFPAALKIVTSAQEQVARLADFCDKLPAQRPKYYQKLGHPELAQRDSSTSDLVSSIYRKRSSYRLAADTLGTYAEVYQLLLDNQEKWELDEAGNIVSKDIRFTKKLMYQSFSMHVLATNLKIEGALRRSAGANTVSPQNN
jgi:hypothetical protein